MKPETPLPKFFLLITHHNRGISPPIVKELQANTREEAEVEADIQLRGHREDWIARQGSCEYGIPNVEFSLGVPSPFLHPGLIPPVEARLVELVNERPVAEFQREIMEWATPERNRIEQEVLEDPEYIEFLRLRKKFSKHG